MKVLHGLPAAPGLALGPAFVLHTTLPVDPDERRETDAATETARLDQAVAQAIALLERVQSTTTGPLADILLIQREMLADPEMKRAAGALIAGGSSAAAAITQAASLYAGQLASLADPYLAARAEDVRETGRRIVAELRGERSAIVLDRPAVLVAHDLSPAELVSLDARCLLAVVSETGSALGHLAIVAQGLDIPAVVGVAGALTEIQAQQMLIVDGESGMVTREPDEVAYARASQHLREIENERRVLEVFRQRPGLTADQVHISVFANIGSLAEARKAVEMGAEGVGLFRTELLTARGLPSEETQERVYEEVASLLDGPLVVRTFDIGGDKPVPGLNLAVEANPFLGWRGLRLSLDRPAEVFLPQVRALLRASQTHDIRILLPMVSTPQEVEAARRLIEQARSDLAQAGHSLRQVPLGIMVETPAAALTLDQFAGLLDFASVGTNDLVQYTYAVDRTNPQVRAYAPPLGTAILRLIGLVCQAGLPIAVCGQLAADPEAIPLLVGLGVRELSVPPARVCSVKALLANLTLPEMQQMATEALAQPHPPA
jgi:phosphoenolpyruvate-protein phosphotransferase